MMKTIQVVAAMICRGNKVFAVQRGYGDFKDGWEFPGGKIEPLETPEQALVREIQEELQTEIHVENYIDTIEYDYPSFHLSMQCYWCSIVSGKLTLLEAEDASWLSADELDSVDWLPADRIVIQKIKEQMKK